MITISTLANYAQKMIFIKTQRLDAFESKNTQRIEKSFD